MPTTRESGRGFGLRIVVRALCTIAVVFSHAASASSSGLHLTWDVRPSCGTAGLAASALGFFQQKIQEMSQLPGFPLLRLRGRGGSVEAEAFSSARAEIDLGTAPGGSDGQSDQDETGDAETHEVLTHTFDKKKGHHQKRMKLRVSKAGEIWVESDDAEEIASGEGDSGEEGETHDSEAPHDDVHGDKATSNDGKHPDGNRGQDEYDGNRGRDEYDYGGSMNYADIKKNIGRHGKPLMPTGEDIGGKEAGGCRWEAGGGKLGGHKSSIDNGGLPSDGANDGKGRGGVPEFEDVETLDQRTVKSQFEFVRTGQGGFRRGGHQGKKKQHAEEGEGEEQGSDDDSEDDDDEEDYNDWRGLGNGRVSAVQEDTQHSLGISIPIRPRLSAVQGATRMESVPTRMESVPTRMESVPTRMESVPTRMESVPGIAGCGRLGGMGLADDAMDKDLSWAIGDEDWDKAMSLLKEGASVGVLDRHLLEECRHGNVEQVEALLRLGADPGSADPTGLGWQALHYACMQLNVSVIDALVEAGADTDAAALHGIVPLHVAAARGHLAAVRRLVHHGAEPFLSDKNGNNALDIAASARHNETVAYLLELQDGLEDDDETRESDDDGHDGDEKGKQSDTTDNFGF